MQITTFETGNMVLGPGRLETQETRRADVPVTAIRLVEIDLAMALKTSRLDLTLGRTILQQQHAALGALKQGYVEG